MAYQGPTKANLEGGKKAKTVPHTLQKQWIVDRLSARIHRWSEESHVRDREGQEERPSVLYRRRLDQKDIKGEHEGSEHFRERPV